MHVVAAEVEGDKELECKSPLGICGCKIAQQARCCTSVTQDERRHQAVEREDKSTHRSVTMSNTAPNFDDCPKALAACPSNASSKHEIQ